MDLMCTIGSDSPRSSSSHLLFVGLAILYVRRLHTQRVYIHWVDVKHFLLPSFGA